MVDSLDDLHSQVVKALADADALGLDDVGIALDTARLHVERHIAGAKFAGRLQRGLPGDGHR